MCGIVGSSGQNASARTAALVAQIAHRGPDGSGTWSGAGVSLGHTRLAVLDPTDRSAQPFRRGPLTLVYNGEIYNHVELRRSLEARGVRFDTNGDTEVLLELIANEGMERIDQIHGMFAFALWDDRDDSLTLARDRHGIKPLYWTPRADGIDFSSELTPLTVGHRTEINSTALREFLRFGAPISNSIIDGIHELTPGTFVRHDRHGVSVRRYASRAAAAASNGNDAARPTPVDALHTSLEQHARADRPLSLFLSGGFDSAAVLRGLRDGGARPLCLTLATAENAEEVERARSAARHYGVDHEVVSIAESHLEGSIADFLRAMDQPGVDGFNTYLIAQISRAHGCPVALSGLGGDEVLGGYRYYSTEMLMQRGESLVERVPVWIRRRMARAAARATGKSVARLESVSLASGTAARHRAFRTLFTEHEVVELSRGRPGPSLRWDVEPNDDARRQLAQLDRDTYLRPTLLRDADVYSMWHGVELRVPFVDTRVVDSVLSAGAPLTKRELAEAWNDRFLITKADEPKLTFRLPWARWTNTLRALSSEMLADKDPWNGLLDTDVARHLIDDDATADAEPLRPWSLLVLGHWLARRGTPRLTDATSLLTPADPVGVGS